MTLQVRDAAFEAEIVAYLNATGAYKVTRSRPRVARNAAQPSTPAALPCAHCGTPASRLTHLDGGKGRRTAAYRREVGVCESCYRFGPRNKCTPRVLVDPVRYGRLYKAHRHAMHLYHASIRHDPYRGTYSGNSRLMAITKALEAESNKTRPNEEGMAA